MATILPTGKCFDDAVELLEYLVDENPAVVTASRSLWLVHGICEGYDDARTRYAHAWVEMADECIEAGILHGRRLFYVVACERYYAARRVVQATAYNVKSVCRENERTNSFGPWQAEYLALCRTDGRMRVIGHVPNMLTEDTIGICID
jgi:hypothetical protein